MLLLPILEEMKISDDPAMRKEALQLDDKPVIRKNFLMLLQDVLLLPYGVTQDQELPPGMSAYAFKRVMSNNWKAEELEKVLLNLLQSKLTITITLVWFVFFRLKKALYVSFALASLPIWKFSYYLFWPHQIHVLVLLLLRLQNLAKFALCWILLIHK